MIGLSGIWLVITLENELDVSFSNAKYRDIAQMVGLAPVMARKGKTWEHFVMARARLPDGVLKEGSNRCVRSMVNS